MVKEEPNLEICIELSGETTLPEIAELKSDIERHPNFTIQKFELNLIEEKEKEGRSCWDCFYFSQWIDSGKEIEYCEYYQKDISHREEKACDYYIGKSTVECEGR